MALVSSCSQWGRSLTRKPSYTKGGKDVTATETDGEGLASAPTDPTFPEVSVKVTFLDYLLQLATCQFLDHGLLR